MLHWHGRTRHPDSIQLSPSRRWSRGSGQRLVAAAEGFNFIQDFDYWLQSGIAPNATANINIEGVPAGFRRLCNGEIDVAYSYQGI